VAPARQAVQGLDGMPDVALSLVGPKGYVPPDVQQALLAVTARPALRSLLFALLRGGYAALYRARRLPPVRNTRQPR
jgi:hypothetical protein